METDPKKMEFWMPWMRPGPLPANMGDTRFPADGKVETCRVVYPKFDLNHWADFGIVPCVVYATIDRPGHREARVLHPHGLSNLAIHTVKVLE